MASTAACADPTPRVTLLGFADPDFAALLRFLLTYHGFGVVTLEGPVDVAAPLCLPAPMVLLVDGTVPAHLTPLAAALAAIPRCLVLSAPEQEATLQHLLPQASFLSVPVVPSVLLARVRTLLGVEAGELVERAP